MKRCARYFLIGGTAVIGLFLTACGSGSSTTPPPSKTLSSIAVTAAASSFAVGATDQFTATGTYSDNSTADLTSTATWVSSSTVAATISSAGLATGVAAGTTNITARSGTVTSPAVALTVTALTSVAQWAQTVAYGSSGGVNSEASSGFNSVSADSSGNAYAAGYIDAYTYYFSNGVGPLQGSALGALLLVQYNSSGEAQWAQTVSGPSCSGLQAVSVDNRGNVYAAGFTCSGGYDFGNGVTVVAADPLSNTLLVKYNSSGAAQWARSLVSGSAKAQFTSVSVDRSGNIYTAGYISGTGAYDFGNNVTAAGVYSGGKNIILVKYDPSGVAQWAHSVTSASASVASSFTSVSVDSNGNVYAAGAVDEGVYNFGNGVTANSLQQYNIVLVKYSTSGVAQWAQTVTFGSAPLYFNSVSVDSSGNIYAAGHIVYTGQFNFGNNVVISANNTDPAAGNILLVKYNTSGVAQWAQTVASASNNSGFNAVNVDNSGNIYAAGSLQPGTCDFGNNVTVTGIPQSQNTLLVQYNSSGEAQAAQTVTAVGDVLNNSGLTSVSEDSSGNVYAAGYIDGYSSFTFGSDVTATGYANVNILLVKY